MLCVSRTSYFSAGRETAS